MTLNKANELIAMHVDLGSGYNRNAVKMVLGEVVRDHKLEDKWEIKPGIKFTSAFKS
jgi:hypothetical protein